MFASKLASCGVKKRENVYRVQNPAILTVHNLRHRADRFLTKEVVHV
jgi:hypothetical protein